VIENRKIENPSGFDRFERRGSMQKGIGVELPILAENPVFVRLAIEDKVGKKTKNKNILDQ
jgi:hypothetical protein